MANEMTPSYLEADFSTLKQKLQEELLKSETFKDITYEGSNISILMELVAYLGEFTTFYLNKLAKNVYLDTADIYECVHRLSRQIGYEPRGSRAARATLTIQTSAGFNEGDTLYISPWQEIQTGQNTEDGEVIYFSTTIPTVTQVPSAVPSGSSYIHEFEIPVRQGRVIEITGNKGEDLIDNQLLIDTGSYGYDDDLNDSLTTLDVTINGQPWTRVPDFYDKISGLQDLDKVYMFRYDKYGRYVIEFSTSRSIPESNDEIEIKLIETLGADGNVGANTITEDGAPDDFVMNVSNPSNPTAVPVIINNNSAATGGSSPESTNQVKVSAKSLLHAQYRNVTKSDYKSYLESRADVVKSNAWGEQEIAPSGSLLEYNKVHLSIIPPNWGTGTIGVSAAAWSPTAGTSGTIYLPYDYNDNYKNNLKVFLEPRKMLNAYEVFEIPELIYFALIFGIRAKRGYNFSDIVVDLKNKLSFYFNSSNREFGETINWMNILEYLEDPANVSDTDDFENIKGIRNITIREIFSNKTIYEPNDLGKYPQYAEAAFGTTIDNKLRRIKLYYNQFPATVGNLNTVQVEL
jgi:hypothetical protein